MNNVVIRKVDVTATYQPLSVAKEVLSVEISMPPTNAGPVYFRGDGGEDVPAVPGEWHFLEGVDLSAIFVRGSPGDMVTIFGGSR